MLLKVYKYIKLKIQIRELSKLKNDIDFKTGIGTVTIISLNKSSVVNALGKLGEIAIEPILEFYKTEKTNWVPRFGAIKALGLIGGKQIIEPVAEALNDSSETIREVAADILLRHNDQRAVDYYITFLEVNVDRNKNALILPKLLEYYKKANKYEQDRLLGKMQLFLQGENLIKITSPNYSNDSCAILLSKFKSISEEPLIKIMQNEKQYKTVQITAAWALGYISSDKSISTIINTLKTDSIISNDIIEVIASKNIPKLNNQILDYLEKCLTHHNDFKNLCIISGLEKIQSIRATNIIVNALLHGDEYIRSSAAQALKDKLEERIEILKSQFDEGLQIYAYNSFSKRNIYCEDRCRKKTIEEWAQKHFGKLAAFELGILGNSNNLEVIIRSLKKIYYETEEDDFNDYYRNKQLDDVIEILGIISGDDELKIFAQILINENKKGDHKLIEKLVLRNETWVLKTIEKSGIEIPTSRLTELLNEELLKDNTSECRAIIKRLNQVGGPSVVKTLLEVMNMDKPFVAMEAIKALGNLGDEYVIVDLTKFLEKKDLFSRYKARYVSPESFEMFKDDIEWNAGIDRIVKNAEEMVRITAEEALEKLRERYSF